MSVTKEALKAAAADLRTILDGHTSRVSWSVIDPREALPRIAGLLDQASEAILEPTSVDEVDQDALWRAYLYALIDNEGYLNAAEISEQEAQVAAALARSHRQTGQIWSKRELALAIQALRSGVAIRADRLPSESAAK